MPANSTISANTVTPMLLTCCETECTYGNMAEIFFCVRVELRNKYASILGVMSKGSTPCQNCQDFFCLF